MMHRSTADGLICITQPAHAWVSGQLAQAWGNEEFGSFAPRQEVCQAAAQHDIGWLQWETAPSRNPNTGYPYHFTELPTPRHVELWSTAHQLTLPFGRYVALLVSLHGTRLYETHTSWQESPTARPLVESFLQREKQFQHDIVADLQHDPAYQPYATNEAIARNRDLIATWDWLSILLCTGFTQEQQIPNIPTDEGAITLTLTPSPTDPTQVGVAPWVFSSERVTLVVEGRSLDTPSHSDHDMQHQLAKAPWHRIPIVLHPQ